MLSVVCFKWRPAAGYRSVFGPETANTLQRMVARHYPHPHRFFCVTDDPTGIDPSIIIVPLWHDFAAVPSPHGGNNPSCYRRLKLFDPAVASTFGSDLVCLDLDTVITGDLSPLWNRPEEFVIWGETNRRSWYNGSMFRLKTGSRPQLWTDFDPKMSPAAALKAGKFGSDQGWISYRLGKGEATWSTADGVYSYRVHLQPKKSRLPANARIVMFHGHQDPWSKSLQQIPWIREHYLELTHAAA